MKHLIFKLCTTLILFTSLVHAECDIALYFIGSNVNFQSASVFKDLLEKELKKFNSKNSVTIINSPYSTYKSDYMITVTRTNYGPVVALGNLLTNRYVFEKSYIETSQLTGPKLISLISYDIATQSFKHLKYCK